MRVITLTDELSLRKADINYSIDKWVLSKLDHDLDVQKFLWPLENSLKNFSHIVHDRLYCSPFIIWKHQIPIGFLEVSDIFDQSYVDLSYAILKEHRGNGYASQVTKEVTHQILSDTKYRIKQVLLLIDIYNLASITVANRAGFLEDSISERDRELNGYTYYYKNKYMDKINND